MQIGKYTYGTPNIKLSNDYSNLTIGNFCSIGNNVSIYLGGEHRTDYVTTYPFGYLHKNIFTSLSFSFNKIVYKPLFLLLIDMSILTLPPFFVIYVIIIITLKLSVGRTEEKKKNTQRSEKNIIEFAGGKIIALVQPRNLSKVVQRAQHSIGKQKQLKRYDECNDTGEYH